MTPEEKRIYQRAYSRGYNAGSAYRWPEHRPPMPPEQAIAEMMQALTDLCGGVDGYLATLSPDDEIEEKLGPLLDKGNEALARVGHWLRSDEVLGDAKK